MPKGIMRPPLGFGGDGDPAWHPSADHDPTAVLSTHALHRVLAAVRHTWPRTYPGERFSGQALAAKLGGSVRPVQKRLAGAQPLTLGDVLTLAALFGDAVLQALPREESDLFPADYDRLLSHWTPGAGELPVFSEPNGEAINWAAAVDELAAYDAGEFASERSHLLTADTYRYELASALGRHGAQVSQVEYSDLVIDHSRVMTLYSQPRVTIVICDLLQVGTRARAAAAVVNVLHQTVTCDTAERVLILIAGTAAVGQIQAHLPAALGTAGQRFSLSFQHAIAAGLTVDDTRELLPDIELMTLGHGAGAPHQHVIALRVGK
ncbi:hypothetical protein [Mycobacterium sp. NPDC050853]|uniref:hypothetical protein n=1 Tax=Mycobacterium sp. NPDC050853 TaxID=3155160 RepID=UPI0033CCBF20